MRLPNSTSASCMNEAKVFPKMFPRLSSRMRRQPHRGMPMRNTTSASCVHEAKVFQRMLLGLSSCFRWQLHRDMPARNTTSASCMHEAKVFQRMLARLLEWYEKAAEQGHAHAQNSLGVKYDKGEGLPQDAAKAVEWFQKAAEQGDADAQNSARPHAQQGEGVPMEAGKAVEWYEKAAEQGDAYAPIQPRTPLCQGEGVPKDPGKAVEWFQKAAEQGNTEGNQASGSCTRTAKALQKTSARVRLVQSRSSERGRTAKNLRDPVEKNSLPTSAPKDSGWPRTGNKACSSFKDEPPMRIDQPLTVRAKRVPHKRMTGTGFVLSDSGHILTNNHVVEGYTELKISGREGAVKLLATDIVNDLALLQLAGETKDFATLPPDSYELRQGEDILVYGYPLNAVLSTGGNLPPGLVSALTGLGNNTNQIDHCADTARLQRQPSDKQKRPGGRRRFNEIVRRKDRESDGIRPSERKFRRQCTDGEDIPRCPQSDLQDRLRFFRSRKKHC